MQTHRKWAAEAFQGLSVLEILSEDSAGVGDDLARGLGLCLDRYDTVGAAAERLMADPVDLLVLELGLADRNGIELLGVLETLGLRIPTLIFAPRPRPVAIEALHAFVCVVSPASFDQPARLIGAALERAVVAPDGPMFSAADYLRLALELTQSVDLRLYFGGGQRLQLEVVGGDLWNAYRDERVGFAALERLPDASPQTVEARHLRSVPTVRQIIETGSSVLRRLRVRSARSSAAQSAAMDVAADTSLDTAEIDRGDVVALRRGRGDTPAEEAPAPPTARPTAADSDSHCAPEPSESPAERSAFDKAFAEGIDAAFHRDYPRSIAAFERALELRPNDRRVRFNISRIRRLLGG